MQAVDKEWKAFLDLGAVEIIRAKEAVEIYRTKKTQITTSRCVFTDVKRMLMLPPLGAAATCWRGWTCALAQRSVGRR